MGANGYRTSHYQQTEAYMDAFDEMGFLVMDEARWFDSTEESFEQIESLVKRDRNRPCVIFWSTSNEEPNHVTDVGRRLHKAIAAHIKKFDYTRTVTAAQDKTPEHSTIYDECELIGINYNLNIYDKVHEMQPDKPVFSSECCATGTSRDWNYDYDGGFRLKDKDRDANDWFRGREKTYKFLRSRPYVFGAFQWAAVEHRGEAAWPAMCSKSGALDIFLYKKGAFYQNMSHWTEAPMAHIVPHWNFRGLEGENIIVTVYTNCDELELFLNGSSLGRKAVEKYGHGEWNVPYEAGTLSVIGYRDGKQVCEDTRRTTGKAVSLRLSKDIDFEANGRDIALFTCECLDENGCVVPDAAEVVQFSVNEPARVIATGSDHCDHVRISSNIRKMYMGKIRVAVKPAKGQNKVVLTAIGDTCGVARLTVDL
jgi:beta-galactosidase